MRVTSTLRRYYLSVKCLIVSFLTVRRVSELFDSRKLERVIAFVNDMTRPCFGLIFTMMLGE